jgi:hypothetical protein
MSKKKKGVEALVMLPELFNTAVDSRVVMVDQHPVKGVAWDPKKGLWRAYLHKGKKQVYHSYHEQKEYAVEARLAAEARFGDTAVPKELEAKPGMFKRFNRAPKLTDRFGSIMSVSMVADTLHLKLRKASNGWSDDDQRRRSPLRTAERAEFGRSFGMLLALGEYLIMTGDLRVPDIKAGMATQALVLGGSEKEYQE